MKADFYEDWDDVMTKIGNTKLRMSSGEVRKFGSEKKRDNFERIAEAVKHGWKPTKRKSKR